MVGEITVTTRSRTEFVEITGDVGSLVRKSGVDEGMALVYVPHTTAAITINENADPTVVSDMAHTLDKTVPWNDKAYRHMEGNSAAHVKSSMFGCSEQVIIKNGELLLGTWQGIYFCEFDGPRTRKLYVRISS